MNWQNLLVGLLLVILGAVVGQEGGGSRTAPTTRFSGMLGYAAGKARAGQTGEPAVRPYGKLPHPKIASPNEGEGTLTTR